VPLVYSLDRVRRLRLVLGVDIVAGALLALLGLFLAVTDDTLRLYAAVVGGAGLLVLALSASAHRLLAGRVRRAKVLSAVAGGVTLVVGFLFAKVILGFAMILLGLVLLVLALLRDDPDLVT
jgi:hypothetical protein